MSVYQPFLIANMRVGQERDLQPWLLPDDAFPTLFNAYQFRGIIYKKGGETPLGRLGVRTDYFAVLRGAGANTYNLSLLFPPIEPGSIKITDGVTTFTDDGVGGFVITGSAGNTVNAPTNYTTGAIDITFANGNAGATVTANYIVAVNANSPVMGLCTREVPNMNTQDLEAFDMVASYEWQPSSLSFVQTQFYKNTSNYVAWTGTNYEFFDSTNYQNAFWATNGTPGGHFYSITAITNAAAAQVTTSVANNFAMNDTVYFNNVTGMTQINGLTGTVTIAGNPFTVNINSAGFGAYTGPSGIAWEENKTATGFGDGIRWFDGFTAGVNPATGWVNFSPPLNSSAIPQLLMGTLLIFPYKDRLVCLNTFEGTSFGTAQQFPQRARWSQNQLLGPVFFDQHPANTTSIPPSDPTAWYDIPGKGGHTDCPTQEEIIAAEFIKDTLVVYFERSVYRLAYTGNPTLPFVWEKVNTEIGSDSTFSPVPFDRAVISVGSNGIYACDSINIERLDQKIPDDIFNVEAANQGQERVQGIRDFFTQFVYWTYPDFSRYNTTFSNVFPNRMFVLNYLDRSWSIFENYYTALGYYRTDNALTWAGATNPWETYNMSWDSSTSQSGFPEIVAGNQQGLVVYMQNVDAEQSNNANAPSRIVQGISGASPSVITSINHNFNDVTYILFEGVNGATGLNGNIFQVKPINANTFRLIDINGNLVTVGGVYTFGGTMTIVNDFQITSKRFNPFINLGKKTKIGYADFFFQCSDAGAVQIQLFVDENYTSTGAYQTKIVNMQPTVAVTEKQWYRVYFDVVAQTVAFEISFSEDLVTGQIWDPDIIESDFQLHGIVLWMAPSGRFI